MDSHAVCHYFCTFAALVFFFVLAEATKAQHPFTFITYNCENAFDTIPNPSHDDGEYLPNGKMRWTRARYFKKLQRIAKVILAADTSKPLDMAVLQEVESDTVLTHLTRRTTLNNLHYEYVMTHSTDHRGINVAIIYSPRTFRPIAHDSIRLPEGGTRDILHLTGLIHNDDTLDVYALHLPSKLGGNAATQRREALLHLLRQHIDSVMSVRAVPLIIIAGDFNDEPLSPTLRRAFPTETDCTDPKPRKLYNLVSSLPEGSYKYRGHWDWIDQIIVSGAVLLRSDYSPEVQTVRHPELLQHDNAFTGTKPYRTYLGPRYLNGYSDHLPVRLRLRFPYKSKLKIRRY